MESNGTSISSAGGGSGLPSRLKVVEFGVLLKKTSDTAPAEKHVEVIETILAEEDDDYDEDDYDERDEDEDDEDEDGAEAFAENGEKVPSAG